MERERERWGWERGREREVGEREKGENRTETERAWRGVCKKRRQKPNPNLSSPPVSVPLKVQKGEEI